MSTVISARVAEATAEGVRKYAKRKQRSFNETIATALEEWIRQNEFAFIEFRETLDGRIAFMKNSRVPVHWVIEIARSYGMDLARTEAYWPERPRGWTQAAVNYYEAFPEEIDEQIALHSEEARIDNLKRRFPQIEVLSVTDP